jgi:Uma2 family endonuclease
MVEAGILGEGDRVELIEGEVVRMAPIGPRHAAHVNRIADAFSARYRDVALLAVQNPVRLGEWSEPDPDVTLLRRRDDYYASGHPIPADILLLVEVADTSLDYDRGVKLPLYARMGIPEVWLVDLQADVLVVYRDPSPEGYCLVRTVRRGETLAPLAFPDRPLAADDILG